MAKNARAKRLKKMNKRKQRKIHILPELQDMFKECFIDSGCMPGLVSRLAGQKNARKKRIAEPIIG
jgi:hypothetical protein